MWLENAQTLIYSVQNHETKWFFFQQANFDSRMLVSVLKSLLLMANLHYAYDNAYCSPSCLRSLWGATISMV